MAVRRPMQAVLSAQASRAAALAGAVAGNRASPAQHFAEVPLDPAAAGAGAVCERWRIEDQDGAAPGRDDAFGLERLDDAARIAAGDAKHAGELLVGERDLVAADI